MAFQVKISALATILFIVWLGFRNVAESKLDTTLVTRACNGTTFKKTDPFAKSLGFVLKDLIKVTPITKGFEYSNNSTYSKPSNNSTNSNSSSVVFGNASCNKKLGVSKLGVYVCTKCLIRAAHIAQVSCPGVTDAQAVLKDCTVMYSNGTAPVKAQP